MPRSSLIRRARPANSLILRSARRSWPRRRQAPARSRPTPGSGLRASSPWSWGSSPMSEGDAAELAAALEEPGEHQVDTDVFCVLTRFGLRSPHHLVPTLRDYRRVAHDARAAELPGLLRHAFLVENPRSCFSLSI